MFRSGIRLVQLAAAAGLAAIALAPAAAQAAQAAPAPAANGGWAVQSVPVPQAHISLFGSVSCAKPGECVAVGAVKRVKQNADVLIESSKNGVWSIASAPQPGNGGPSVLRSVSCPVIGFCVAVGHTSFAGGGIAPVSEIWNGTTWRMGGAGGGNAILNSVSCSSAKSCVAVGATIERISKNGINTAITHPLIERWNGSGWSVSGGAALASRGQLSSVSCSSADFCMALGTAKLNGSDTFPIAEHWNGVSWKVMTALGLQRNQTSVSCSSSAWCMTAGTSQHGAHMAVAQRWNGHTWKTFALNQPGILHAVSCTSNSACTAIGSSGRGSYAASWNGASWGLAALPAGNHWTSTTLTSVDCTSAVDCAAAGSATKNGLQIPAVEVRS